jgi:hypothetical protein
MTPLIFVHVPKAGGSSTLRALETAYGSAFRRDYDDNPADLRSQRNVDFDGYLQRRERLPDGVACVHGHFHPGKFDPDDGIVLATMLREPVDNLISIYWFWRALPRCDDPLHDRFLDEGLSVEQIAKLPALRRLMCETYFGGFDMRRFDLIGRHDRRAAAIDLLSAQIGMPLDASLHENVTPPSDGRRDMAADASLRQRLEDLLADDVRFYERWAN